MNLFIDSGAGLVLSIRLVLALVLNIENNFIIAKLMIWVWYRYNEWTNHLPVYRRLLTNHLHDVAAKLCLANS